VFVGTKPPSLALLCFVVASVIIPSVAQAARLWPELKAETRFDDNVLRRSEKLQDVIGALTPRLRVTGDEPTWAWELSGQRTFGAYGRDLDPIILGDRLSAHSLYQPSENESLLVDYSYVDALDPFEFDGGLLQRRNSERAKGQARLALHRLEAQVAGRGWWYQEPGFEDGRARSWGIRTFPMRTRISSLSLGHHQQRLDIGDRGLRVDVTTIGARRQHARWLRSEIEVGRSETRFVDGSPSEVNAAGAIAVWMQRGHRADPVEVYVRLARDVTTTVSASVERSWEAGHVKAMVERLLDVEGGLYRNPTAVRRVVMEWQSSTRDARIFTLRGTYGRVRPFRGSGTNANVFRISARFEVPMRPWLTFKSSYDFWRQEYPGGGPDEDFDRHRVAVALTARSGLR